MAPLPLSGLIVLDLTIARAGPTAVRLLADWGANIIRIDAPNNANGSVTGPHEGSDQQNLHRNKRSLTLNLKSEAGKAAFKKMISTADIVVENFRSDVKTRLGIDYETLNSINPRIILASISGFGQSGPYADRPGVDQVIQGMSGLMSITGEPGSGPMRAGIAISDTSAGMFLGQGILLALLHREKTGEGQWVHTSLLEAMLSKLDFQGSRYTMDGEIPTQQGNFHPTQVPMGLFESKDGLVNIAASTNKMWRSFCVALGVDELLEKDDFATAKLRVKNRDALNKLVSKVLLNFSSDELVLKLNHVGVPCGPIYNIGEAFEDPQTQHLKMTRIAQHNNLGALNLVRSPINLSSCPILEEFHHAGPAPGQQSKEILKEFNFSNDEIATLSQAGIIH